MFEKLPEVVYEDGLQMWTVSANKLNHLQRTFYTGWLSSPKADQKLKTSHSKKGACPIWPWIFFALANRIMNLRFLQNMEGDLLAIWATRSFCWKVLARGVIYVFNWARMKQAEIDMTRILGTCYFLILARNTILRKRVDSGGRDELHNMNWKL
jgi:hypothetical protein